MSQAPQHVSSVMQATCDDCFTCQSICSVISLHSGMPREVHKQEFSKVDDIVQELCESRGGRPGLSVLTSLLVSVDVRLY